MGRTRERFAWGDRAALPITNIDAHLARQDMDAEFILVRRSLEGSIKELPPLPTAVMKILEVMARPDPNAIDIEAIVSADQALTAKMLRVVNSAYYGLARQISNVGQAVVILGLQQVRNVTLAVGASSTFRGTGARHQEVLNQFWVHAFATSATAGLLARREGLDRKTSEEVQTCGLVHDIGRLFLFANFPKTFERLIALAEERGLDFDTAELQLLGVSHAQLGGTIAEKWGFPDGILAAIRDHEGPYEKEPGEAAKIVNMADHLNKDAYRFLSHLPRPVLDPTIGAHFEMPDEEWAGLRERTDLLVIEASQSIGVLAA